MWTWWTPWTSPVVLAWFRWGYRWQARVNLYRPSQAWSCGYQRAAAVGPAQPPTLGYLLWLLDLHQALSLVLIQLWPTLQAHGLGPLLGPSSVKCICYGCLVRCLFHGLFDFGFCFGGSLLCQVLSVLEVNVTVNVWWPTYRLIDIHRLNFIVKGKKKAWELVERLRADTWSFGDFDDSVCWFRALSILLFTPTKLKMFLLQRHQIKSSPVKLSDTNHELFFCVFLILAENAV